MNISITIDADVPITVEGWRYLTDVAKVEFIQDRLSDDALDCGGFSDDWGIRDIDGVPHVIIARLRGGSSSPELKITPVNEYLDEWENEALGWIEEGQ